MKKITSILSFYFLWLNLISAQSDDIFNIDNSLRYAAYLAETQDYKNAAIEYARILRFEPENDSLRLNVVFLFRISGHQDSALFYIKGYENKKTFFEKEYININLLIENWSTLASFLKTSSLNDNEKKLAVLHQLMWQGSWKKAQKQLENVEIGNTEKIFSYNNLVEEGIKSPHRNMALAVSMSALVPGLGKVYAGAPLEGVSSFVITGFLAFSAYRGFIQKEEASVPGWLFGAGFVGFYAGNIYGTVKQVKKFNAKHKEKLRNDVKTLVFGDF